MTNKKGPGGDRKVSLVPEDALEMKIFGAMMKLAESLIGQPGFEAKCAALQQFCEREHKATGRYFAPPGTVGQLIDRHEAAIKQVEAAKQAEIAKRDGRIAELLDSVEDKLGTEAFEPELATARPELEKLGVSALIFDGLQACHTRARINKRVVAEKRLSAKGLEVLAKRKDRSVFEREKWEVAVFKRHLFATLVEMFLTLRMSHVSISDEACTPKLWKEDSGKEAKIIPFPLAGLPAVSVVRTGS